MGYTAEERARDRAAYSWASVVKDIALSTPLTVSQAVCFSEVYFKTSGIHPFDLVEWVATYYRSEGTPHALASMLRHAYSTGYLDAHVGAES